MRVLARVPHEPIQRLEHPVADVVLEFLGVLVHLAPVELEHTDEEGLEQAMTPEHLRRGPLPAGDNLAAPRAPTTTSRSAASRANMLVTLGAETRRWRASTDTGTGASLPSCSRALR